MVEIKINYDKENKRFDVDSDLIGGENRIIFAELIAGVSTALKDLSVKMAIPTDSLVETFCGALTESVLKE